MYMNTVYTLVTLAQLTDGSMELRREHTVSQGRNKRKFMSTWVKRERSGEDFMWRKFVVHLKLI